MDFEVGYDENGLACWQHLSISFQSTVADCASLVADSMFFVQYWSGAAAKKMKTELFSVVDLVNFPHILQADGAMLNEPVGLWRKFGMMVASFLQQQLFQ